MSIWKLTTLGIAILLLTFAGSISPGAVSAQQTSACTTGGAVPDAANNPGLVSDCAALLAGRDTLAGTATLNWMADTPMSEWDGVTVGGTPKRVWSLKLTGRALTGEIPTELGNLSNLRWLDLSFNQLTGEIPAELGDLSNLQLLYLGDNQLTGEIPTQLGHLSNLEDLRLASNQLTGALPMELGNLTNLNLLWLVENQLTGVLPQTLTGLTELHSFIFNFNPGLCAPTNEAFQTWLASIVSVRGSSCAQVDSMEDRAVLVKLYSATDGQNWEENVNWLSDRPVREWHGITNDANGRVTGLYLSSNQLAGLIPTELGTLSNLQELQLSSNQLTGPIPTELGTLSNLQELQLSSNQLTGPIPTELGTLSNLQELQLSFNQLTGPIPTELGTLSKLEELVLIYNQLTGGIPTELGNLSLLELLVLHGNQLEGEIPPELGYLSNLHSLDLRSNELTGEIPAGLTNLTRLFALYLSGNQLTGCIPEGLRDVRRNDLDQLGLPYCSASSPGAPTINAVTPGEESLAISWSSPSSGGSAITAYDLRYIETSDDETTDSNWTVVQDVWTTGGGALQYTLTGLNSGTEYDLQVRAVKSEGDGPWSATATGTPADAGDCASGGAVFDPANNPGLVSDCAVLLAARDTLAGTATLNWAADTPMSEWDGVSYHGTPERVTELSLNSRSLTGEIPTELGNLSNLWDLNLNRNQLTGEIPTELGNLSNLTGLSLSSNQLTGEIPTELGNLSNLQRLNLHDNRLTGELPQSLTGLTVLVTLSFYNNAGLCAPIDEAFQIWLQSVTSVSGSSCAPMDSAEDRAVLVELYNATDGANWTNNTNWLSDRPIREWHGVINDADGRVSELLLGRNEMAGEIPTELGNLSSLQWLWLNNNQLTGEIPTALGNLSNLTRLYLNDNQLTGEIPAELGDLSNLQFLRLSSNQLTGEIPAELGNLTGLTILRLSSNQLTGEIPAELGNLTGLTFLHLANNQFTGCMQDELRHFSTILTNDLDMLGLAFCTDLPGSPMIDEVTSGTGAMAGTLLVEWSAPASEGISAITTYDLRYIETTADETVDANWTVVEDVWTTGGGALEYTVTGLTADTEYDLQVRAVNEAGDGPWSATVTGTPTTSVCVSGGAVADATNTGLISDCVALLGARDILAGTATLNWATDTSITQWEGVGLGGTPRRVTRLNLNGKDMSGMIPSVLGRLSMLTYLNLRSNDGLTGEIPSELGYLSNLKVLNLHSNTHSGSIPDLSGMTSLEELYLANNDLTGSIPMWLNGMTNMEELWLWGNSLTGTVPNLSGMTSLQKLKLANNMLTGGIPEASTLPPNMTWLIIDRNPFGGTIPDLSSLTRLRLLWLHSNGLTGEIPAGDMLPASLDDLNLRDNMLTGTIPDLSGLDKLTRLRLHNNSLSGEVPATLGDLDMLRQLWLHNEVDKGLGNNSFTSIAAGLGDLSDTLIEIALNGNPWADDACVPVALANVAKNDYTEAGIEVCESGDGS